MPFHSFPQIPANSLASARRTSRRRRSASPVSHSVVSRETKQIDGLQVTILRKHNRNMYVRVKPPYGLVEITAPVRVSMKEIEQCVRERHDWILQAQQQIAQARSRTLQGYERQNATEGATAINTDDTKLQNTETDDTEPSHVPALKTPEDFRWNETLMAQARQQLEQKLPALVEQWSAAVGRKPTSITLRTMTSRWGSCTPRTGRIRLNLQLGLMEPQFLEYVLVHELVHLWESGHGAGFQRRMSAVLPNWRQLRRELNRRAVLEPARKN
ncbi:SprT family zinc-dependent metalloprotease [Bifidobacterium dolichotidis]|nr:SprT family zinc-dependent metalloprotease [Bifidobacterium dolichotidis]